MFLVTYSILVKTLLKTSCVVRSVCNKVFWHLVNMYVCVNMYIDVPQASLGL